MLNSNIKRKKLLLRSIPGKQFWVKGKMMRRTKEITRNILTFFVAVSVMLGLLAASAMIPREAVRPQMRRSAEYMVDREEFPFIIEGVYGSQTDHYADSVLLNVVYHFDDADPVRSVLWSKYYVSGKELQNAREDFLASVENDYSANLQYLRYWHGSAVFLRPFHLFWSIREIYVFHACMICCLSALLLYLLARRGYKAEAAVFCIGMLSVCIWCVPFCLEFYWCFLVMLAACIAGVLLSAGKVCDMIDGGHVSDRRYEMLFMASGMATAYLDFLSCETLTLTVPLLLMLRTGGRTNGLTVHMPKKSAGQKGVPAETVSARASSSRAQWLFAIRSCLWWAAGYAGTWIMKWVTASAILGENVMPYVNDHISERIDGFIGPMSGMDYLTGAVARNIRCLFYFDYGLIGTAALLILILAVVIPVLRGKLDLRRKIDPWMILLYFAIGLIPYVRYLALHNHAWRHYFFTYRAQAGSVMALCFVLLELLERSKSASEQSSP